MGRYRDENEDIEFDFGEDEVIKLDTEKAKHPQFANDKSADFAVLPPTDPALVIEVKDPSTPGAIAERRKKWLTDLLEDIDGYESELVQKCIDSLRHLAMWKPGRNVYEFIALLGVKHMYKWGFDDSILGPMQTRIGQQLRIAATVQVVSGASVVTEKSWKDVLPQYPLRRVSEG
jgi:hypothetical protein